MNFADSRQRRMWFSHPLIGDCSFDSFRRYGRNPIHTGKGLWEWPVNGFLFIDPVSSNWYVYVSLYAKGYVPLGTITLLRSTDRGVSWENIGPVFDGRGLAERYNPPGGAAVAALDASVVYDGETYHMVYGWGALTEPLGGIAYASAKRPEGPFIKHPHPIKNEVDTPLIDGIYQRTYASTLIRRAADWMIVTMMSTPRNEGGTWALVALTAQRPEGPYGEPRFLLYPQSKIFHPAPIEFYPSFVHDGCVYAPATSVGRNRSYQAVFRAKLEEAHEPEAWELAQEGSCWHSVPLLSERQGIWGQTFSGQVADGDTLWVMYPALNQDGCGTINIASRPWAQPYEDRFTLSANNARAASFIRSGYETFRLEAEFAGNGPFSLVWGWSAPVGAQAMPRWADGQPHDAMFASCHRLQLTEDGFRVLKVGASGEAETVAQTGGLAGERDGAPHLDNPGESAAFDAFPSQWKVSVSVKQEGSSCTVRVNGELLTCDLPALPGRIGLIAENGTIVDCTRFTVEGEPVETWVDLLATDGLGGAAQSPAKWDLKEAASYRHGFGFRSTDRPGYARETASVVKWNFRGTAFRLWMPVLGRGKIRAELNGELLAELELTPDGLPDSRVVLERHGLPERNYALVLTLMEGEMRCDAFSFKL